MVLTFTRQNHTMKNHINSTIVAALEKAWAAIHKQHPDVPAAVMVVASGSQGGKLLKLGHFAQGRWVTKQKNVEKMHKTRVSEVLVSAEGLEQGGASVMETLLHEAAHGLAATRELKDTSRGSRYHNRVFKGLAEELGLDVEKHSATYGLAKTSMTKETTKRWKTTIQALSKAINRKFRLREMSGTVKAATRMLLAMCECGTKIRLSRAAYEAARITCGACEGDFAVDE